MCKDLGVTKGLAKAVAAMHAEAQEGSEDGDLFHDSVFELRVHATGSQQWGKVRDKVKVRRSAHSDLDTYMERMAMAKRQASFVQAPVRNPIAIFRCVGIDARSK
jgi:hypothetical protein